MKITIKLAEVLREKNISQRDLARKTNIRPASINEMCKNETQRIPLDNLAKICDVLDCEITDILILDKEVPKND
ncbi:helix-turn-helix domain-containing protein [Anaerobacillus isosaccharinicus]|uniref:Transcriptional regulator n=1 Tax=Anaerobacillus isosaccharinicus TaxID=1532552 RepID=A0A1S2L9J1_9BACI|nr:helix-turn-helix transcriptional regulator [Anaerobacillus isosaccharinicus]MBA5584587.1 helix-turn-helix transcriptional regulator [Anaerobacillus isosaccharinicus]QOY37033.1 helix-turn-helix transcriptional regulator [Anaerobacillus isosaccharinicus]